MVGLDNVSKLLILLNIPPYCTLLKNKQNPQQQKVLVLVEKSIHTADTLYYLKSLLSLRRSWQESAYYLLLLQKTPYCSFRLNVENINSQCWGIKRNKLFQHLKILSSCVCCTVVTFTLLLLKSPTILSLSTHKLFKFPSYGYYCLTLQQLWEVLFNLGNISICRICWLQKS